MIAWQDFTPWASLAGGMLIGASAAVLITLLGRVAGDSVDLSRELDWTPEDIKKIKKIDY